MRNLDFVNPNNFLSARGAYYGEYGITGMVFKVALDLQFHEAHLIFFHLVIFGNTDHKKAK